MDLIKNAKLVVTTSFHGTVFSTVFNKNFWVVKNGGMLGDDDRVKTLLEQLNYQNRLIDPNNYNIEKIFEDVDYTDYKKNLEKARENSMQFLKEALDDIK